MKILHITPSYKPAYIYGGVVESVARLCEGLAEAGHEVEVFTSTANGKTELSVQSNVPVNVKGVKVRYFKRITKDPTHVSLSLWKHLWFHAKDFDAIHIHSWWNLLVVGAAMICSFKNVRVLISPRGMLCSYIFNNSHVNIKRLLHLMIGRRLLSKSIFHATAEAERDECEKLIVNWNGFVLPNILDLSSERIKRTTNSVFTLIFLSRIHPKKGIELLFQSLAGLPFPATLKMVGSGDENYVSKLKTYAVDLGVANQIEWLGWKDRNEKFAELANSDCFILTSYNENFANVVIESLHVGTPVIISDAIGLAPFIKASDLGWITPLYVEAIRATIKKAYEDDQKRKFVNLNSRTIIDSSFAQNVLIRKYVHQYKALSEQDHASVET